MRCSIQPRLILGFAVAMCLPLNGCAVVEVPNAATHDFALSYCQECQTPHSAPVDREVLQAPGFEEEFDHHGQPAAETCKNGLELSNFGEPAGFGATDCLWGRLKQATIPRLPPLWHKREEVPEAPPFPRFHPLPVRPMFAPASTASADDQWHGNTPYGAFE